MCGIAGILTFDRSPVHKEEIETLTNALSHRGRDSSAYCLGGSGERDISRYPGIALGHRRLSIIDLSSKAAQPMRSKNTRTSIVYNGELYNYRELRSELVAAGFLFHTNSDTEVVLVAYEAWGESCLQRFNGMFAFAIWDESSQSLFCARDPIGIKPFYYSNASNRFTFASESQALSQSKAHSLDHKAVACYFLSMYVPRHLSILSGVNKLLPGHSMRILSDGKISVQKYWNLNELGARHSSSRDASIELNELLDKAVKAQTRSDVPVGALLSGGFDSGMIVSSASRAGIPLHTYSVGFDDGVQTSELPIASNMAARYGTTHHEKVITGNEVIDLLDKAIVGMSEPVADSAIVPTYCLSKMASDDGVKVLLSGTGGDEVFAGYSRYVASSLKRRIFFLMPHILRSVLGKTLFSRSINGMRMQNSSLDMLVYAGGSPLLARQLFEDDISFWRFLEELVEEVFPVPVKNAGDLYENMMFDLQVYLPDLLLMLLDQLTMAHTIEGRVPLLDIDIIKASYSLISNLHASPIQSTTRRLMREMAIKRVEEETFSSNKLGFSGPVLSWVSQNSAMFRETIMMGRDIPAIRRLPLEQLWKSGEKKMEHSWAMDMFSIYSFSRWCMNHG
jgi:asparagine synthase (glutamine-hydrolysing)